MENKTRAQPSAPQKGLHFPGCLWHKVPAPLFPPRFVIVWEMSGFLFPIYKVFAFSLQCSRLSPCVYFQSMYLGLTRELCLF